MCIDMPRVIQAGHLFRARRPKKQPISRIIRIINAKTARAIREHDEYRPGKLLHLPATRKGLV